MEGIEVMPKVLLSVAVGCLCLAVLVGLIALRLSPWWRKRPKRKKRSTAKYPIAKKESSDETRRTDAMTLPKRPRPRTLSETASRSYASQPYGHLRPTESSDNLLPSGHRRGEYHRYGATDGDIEFWGLDQLGAPPPDVAGWVVMDLLDEMDAGGDGLIDDPFDDPFF